MDTHSKHAYVAHRATTLQQCPQKEDIECPDLADNVRFLRPFRGRCTVLAHIRKKIEKRFSPHVSPRSDGVRDGGLTPSNGVTSAPISGAPGLGSDAGSGGGKRRGLGATPAAAAGGIAETCTYGALCATRIRDHARNQSPRRRNGRLESRTVHGPPCSGSAPGRRWKLRRARPIPPGPSRPSRCFAPRFSIVHRSSCLQRCRPRRRSRLRRASSEILAALATFLVTSSTRPRSSSPASS
jgi:hypothetical protein